MIKVEILFGLVTLCLFLFCFIEVIQTPEGEHRHLSKLYWLAIVFFLPFVGSIAWLVAGRPQKARPNPYNRRVSEFPEYDRPGRAVATNPDDDAEFLRRTRERAEEQRRRYEQEKREREQKRPDEN